AATDPFDLKIDKLHDRLWRRDRDRVNAAPASLSNRDVLNPDCAGGVFDVNPTPLMVGAPSPHDDAATVNQDVAATIDLREPRLIPLRQLDDVVLIGGEFGPGGSLPQPDCLWLFELRLKIGTERPAHRHPVPGQQH